jgi:drug/metabolite transporter (DMT)-like permease
MRTIVPYHFSSGGQTTRRSIHHRNYAEVHGNSLDRAGKGVRRKAFAGASMSPSISPQKTGLILGFIGVAIFGATLPMTRLALVGFSPLFITFARAVIAATAASCFLFHRGKSWPKGHGLTLVVIGICLVFGFPVFSSIAMQTLPASHGGVILGLLPLLTSIFAAIVEGERPSPLCWLCGVVGAGLVIAYSIRESGFHPAVGDLWLLAAAISAAFGYVLSARLSRILSGWESISWALVVTLPFTLIGTFVTASSGIHAPTPQAYAGLAYLGVMSMFGGFVFWNEGLARGGTARVSQVQLLQSFFTLGFSTVLLAEHVTLETVVFAFLVILTVWLARKARFS